MYRYVCTPRNGEIQESHDHDLVGLSGAPLLLRKLVLFSSLTLLLFSLLSFDATPLVKALWSAEARYQDPWMNELFPCYWQLKFGQFCFHFSRAIAAALQEAITSPSPPSDLPTPS